MPFTQGTTTVYRKDFNTHLTIKPESCQDPMSWIGSFKGALCTAYRYCSSPDLLKSEITFLVNDFEDNRFDRRVLNEIADSVVIKHLQASLPEDYMILGM